MLKEKKEHSYTCAFLELRHVTEDPIFCATAVWACETVMAVMKCSTNVGLLVDEFSARCGE